MVNTDNTGPYDMNTRITKLEKNLGGEKIISRSSILIGGIAVAVSIFSLISRHEDGSLHPASVDVKQITTPRYPDINARSIHLFDNGGKEVAYFDGDTLYFGSGDQFPGVDNPEPIGTTINALGITINSEKQSMDIASSGLSILGNNPHRASNATSRYDNRIDIRVAGSGSDNAIEITEHSPNDKKTENGDYYLTDIGRYGLYIENQDGDARLAATTLSLDGNRKGSSTLGEAQLRNKKTGAEETTSVGSLILFDKDGTVRWRTQ